jgi:hypothetical protein
VAEAAPHFSALELHGPGEGEGVEPGRGGAAGTSEKARASAPAVLSGRVVRHEEGVETGFGLVPGEGSLGPGDVAGALGVNLLQLWLPEVAPLAVASH